MPTRIQQRRTKGWRMPFNAKSVARPSKWGNPYRVMPANSGGWEVIGNGTRSRSDEEPWSYEEAARRAVDSFRERIPPRSTRARDARIQLAGLDLACWCRLDQPCHADVLLEIANS